MTTPVATLHAPTDLVAQEWIRTIPGLVCDGVSGQLPEDETKWSTNGFIVVPTSVGGTPHESMALHRPVVQVEFWGTIPGSSRLPWSIPNQLALQVMAGCWDRTTYSRLLTITSGSLTFPYARVKSAKAMHEPRRIWHDSGDYAGYTFDLALQWVAAGEVVQ